MELVDSHCHLYYEPMLNNYEELIKNCRKKGINKLLTIGINLETSILNSKLSVKYKEIYATVLMFHEKSEYDIMSIDFEQWFLSYCDCNCVSMKKLLKILDGLNEIELTEFYDDLFQLLNVNEHVEYFGDIEGFQQIICDFIALSLKYHLQSIPMKQHRFDHNHVLCMVSTYLHRKDSVTSSGLFDKFLSIQDDYYPGLYIDMDKFKSILMNKYDEKGIKCKQNCWSLHYNTKDNIYRFSPRKYLKHITYNNSIYTYQDDHKYCWVLWTNRKLKLYPSSLGYWQILSKYDDTPTVPILHLKAILQLLRDKQYDNFYQNAQPIQFVFSRYNSSIISGFTRQFENKLLINTVIPEEIHNIISEYCQEITAHYQLNLWYNVQSKRASTLSLRLIKAFHPDMDKKKTLKNRDSHFMCFRYDDVEYQVKHYSLVICSFM